MGYLHINNLYKSQEILAFKQCYALEKIHGTSAHIKWDGEKVIFFSGGERYDKFKELFNEEEIKKFAIENVGKKFVVYGEAYGGKCQGMSKTYGKELKFIAFDVQVEDVWLNVPDAQTFASQLNLDFVYWSLINCDICAINIERDKESYAAVINGMGEGHIREGVVLRPTFEVTMPNGQRLIAKHKRAEFSERKSIPEVDQTKREIMQNAEAIAIEWVTPMRLKHVLDKLGNPCEIEMTGEVIKAMIADVMREAEGEIADNKTVKSSIGKRVADMYKRQVTKIEDANES
jgi:hypothetical protein